MTADLAHIDWATPWGSLLALLPFCLAWLAGRRRQRLERWADPHLLPWAITPDARTAARRSLLAWPAWALLALAAAGPRLPLEAAPGDAAQPRHDLGLMVLLDVSASMAAADIAPTRLERARLELADLTRRLHGERVGLLIYAGQAGLLLPPTDDIALFLRAVQQAGPDLLERPGTHLAAALALAQSARPDALLLLTDAESGSLADAVAAPFAKTGVPLYILGLGTPAGAAIPLPDGGVAERDGVPAISRADAAPYRTLARASRGLYAEAEDGDGDWAALYDAGIARLPGRPVAPERARAWRTLHAAPLAAALALFLLAWLPRALPLLLLALALPPETQAAPPACPPSGTMAGSSLAARAWNAWRAGCDADALTLYTRLGGHAGHMGAGAAAWRLKDYAAAARHFGAALLLARGPQQRLDALYNLGGAHYGLGRWQVAAAAYRAVLQARPGDARAAANLAEAELQAARFRAADPAASDLRGRRGQLMQGLVNLDWERETAVREPETRPGGPQIDHSARADAAHLTTEEAARRRIEADARLLASGLRKLEWLEERPRTLLRGLVKQDANATWQGEPW